MEGDSNCLMPKMKILKRELLRRLLEIEKYRVSKQKYLIIVIKTGRKGFVLESLCDLASVILGDGKNNTCIRILNTYIP